MPSDGDPNLIAALRTISESMARDSVSWHWGAVVEVAVAPRIRRRRPSTTFGKLE
jgi:hypothetical protein